ncbi:auxin efflux carrier [Russula brevipes]|nr:auxin efflux carrier [Russula brevipes]
MSFSRLSNMASLPNRRQFTIVCISGYVLARRGMLDKSTQKQLNVINVNFFTPCLLFSKVSFFLSPAKLRELWIGPIFFLLVTGVSLGVAWVLGSLFRLRPSQKNFAMAAATIMNTNSLPIALLQSLAATVPGLEWGDDDTKEAIIGRALTYLLLCGTIGQFIRWSYGVHLLSKSDPLEETEHAPEAQVEAGSRNEGMGVTIPPQRSFGISGDNNDHFSGIRLPSDTESSSVFGSDSDEDEDELHIPAWTRPPPTLLRRLQGSAHSIWKKVTGFLTPPLWASIISLVIALIQPLQHALEVHMHPLQGAITQAGNCSIPLTLVVLGAYFHRPPENSESPPSSTHTWRNTSFVSRLRENFRLKGRQNTLHPMRQGEGKTIFVAILARMVVVPALFLPFIAVGALHDRAPVFQDPVLVLSNVLLLASPPAISLAQITQAVSSDTLERLVSRTIFWSYCFVAPPVMVLYALVAMLITKL